MPAISFNYLLPESVVGSLCTVLPVFFARSRVVGFDPVPLASYIGVLLSLLLEYYQYMISVHISIVC